MSGGATMAVTGGQPPNGNLERRVTVIEAVLPTLATKTDLAELHTAISAEMHSENQKLRAEIRAEMQLENDRLRAEMRDENKKFREEMIAGQSRLEAGLQQFKAEMLASQEKFKDEIIASQEKFKAEMLASDEKFKAEMFASQKQFKDDMYKASEQLQKENSARLDLIHQTLCAEERAMEARVFRWMVGILLTLVIAYVGSLFSFGNLVLTRAHSVAPARTSSSAGAPEPRASVTARFVPPS